MLFFSVRSAKPNPNPTAQGHGIESGGSNVSNSGKEQYVEMKRKDLHDIEFWRSMAEAMVGSNPNGPGGMAPTQTKNVMAAAEKNLLNLARRVSVSNMKSEMNNNNESGAYAANTACNFVLVKLSKSGMVIKVNHDDLAAYAHDGSGGLNGTGHFVFYESTQQQQPSETLQQQQQALQPSQDFCEGEPMYVLPEEYTVIGEATIER